MTTRTLVETTRVFAEKSVQELPEFSEIRERYSEISWIDDYQAFRMKGIRPEKKCLVFARKRGPWLKPFHCYDDPSYRFYSLDVAEGCSFDCVYCYLQSYLNHGALVCFVDFQNLHSELLHLKGQKVWISTGLLTDSVLAENAFPVTERISASLPADSILELRTKAANLDFLGALRPLKTNAIVLSWSLNPEKIVREFEYGTATLEERLQAAQKAVSMGFRVAFHLDPVFYYDDWNSAYSDLFKRLAMFRYENVAFLSLGLFRYMPDLGEIIRNRFPFHPILAGEFFPDRDGKYHYFRGIRKEMYRSFFEWLAPWKEHSVPVFQSMEPDPRLLSRKW